MNLILDPKVKKEAGIISLSNFLIIFTHILIVFSLIMDNYESNFIILRVLLSSCFSNIHEKISLW